MCSSFSTTQLPILSPDAETGPAKKSSPAIAKSNEKLILIPFRLINLDFLSISKFYGKSRMNTTKPMRARASVKAIPKNIVVRTIPADSGCLAMDEIALPTTVPIPTPGPIAARPYPRPAPIAFRPSTISPASVAACAKMFSTSLSCFLF
jgi:hypothetical protein